MKGKYGQLVQERADLKREGAEILAGTERTPEDDARLTAISAQLETLNAGIEREERLRDALMQTGQPIERIPAEPKQQPERFSSFGEQLQAVKKAYVSNGRDTDMRLYATTGSIEGVGSAGGFLLQEDFNSVLLVPMHERGAFSSRVARLPVGNNAASGVVRGVDETSRATGSRWGGIRGYRVAEAGTITPSSPKFRRIAWSFKKYGVMAYATDELLADTAQLQAIISQGAGEELDFMVNDDICNGDGTGGPLGFMNAGSLIPVAKETGQAAATVVYQNIIKMWARLSPRSKQNAVWYINTDVNPQLDQLFQAVGTAGIPANFITYGADSVMRIKGRPVIETEFNQTVGTVGDIVLADLGWYMFWEDAGVQSASSIHVEFLTDQTVFRFTYRCDGQPVLASALTPYKGTATTGPIVALATRA